MSDQEINTPSHIMTCLRMVFFDQLKESGTCWKKRDMIRESFNRVLIDIGNVNDELNPKLTEWERRSRYYTRVSKTIAKELAKILKDTEGMICAS